MSKIFQVAQPLASFAPFPIVKKDHYILGESTMSDPVLSLKQALQWQELLQKLLKRYLLKQWPNCQIVTYFSNILSSITNEKVSALTSLFDIQAIFMPKREPISQKDLHYNVLQPHFGYYKLFEKEKKSNEAQYPGLFPNKIIDEVISPQQYY